MVSDNFQRLNMKHRSYRRRGGGISGAAHKRRAWKQMMKSRGEFVPQKSWSSKGRGGRAGENSGACFKCGEEGHWAKNCRGRRKQTSSLNHWYVCVSYIGDPSVYKNNSSFKFHTNVLKPDCVVSIYISEKEDYTIIMHFNKFLKMFS